MEGNSGPQEACVVVLQNTIAMGLLNIVLTSKDLLGSFHFWSKSCVRYMSLGAVAGSDELLVT